MTKITKTRYVLPMVVAILVGLGSNVATMTAEAQTGYTETIYSPTVMNNLADIINAGTTSETTTIDDDGETVTVRIDTTVNSDGNAHTITYEVYLDGVKNTDQSNTVMITARQDNLYHIVDSNRNILMTSDPFRDADRSVFVRSQIQCIADPIVVGHNRATDPTNCWLQGTGTVDISPTEGVAAWTAPATIYYWFNTYTYDQSRINPSFADVYYANCGSCSLSFDGIYSSFGTYVVTVTNFYN